MLTRIVICLRSLEPAEDKDRFSELREFPLGAQLPAPTAPPTRRVNAHRFRGYNHVPEFEICAIRAALCVM